SNRILSAFTLNFRTSTPTDLENYVHIYVKLLKANTNKWRKSMVDIKNFDTFKKIEVIHKGWSDDKKYYIETATSERLLLRICDIAEYDKKKSEYEIISSLAEKGLPVSGPVDFGLCDNGKSVYTIFL